MNPQQDFSLKDFLSLCVVHGLLETTEEIDAFQTACSKWISDQTLKQNKISLCEVGCGFGRLYAGLKEVKILGKSCDYTGLDASSDYIRYFSRKHPEARLFVFDVLEDDLSLLGKFDVVFLPYTLIHLFDHNEQERLLKVLKSIVHEDGILVIDRLSPDVFGDGGTLRSKGIVVPIPRADNRQPFEAKIYLSSEKGYKETFGAAGFVSVDIVPYLFVGTSRQQYMVLRSSEVASSEKVAIKGVAYSTN